MFQHYSRGLCWRKAVCFDTDSFFNRGYKMVNELDKYILDFSTNDFDEDYWHDEVVNIA